METVQEQLFRLGLVYSQKRSPEVWHILAEEWLDSLPEDMTEKQFVAAVRQAKNRSKFFPVPADVLAAHRELVTHPQGEKTDFLPLACGEDFTEGRVAKNKAKIRELLRRMRSGEPIYQEGNA